MISMAYLQLLKKNIKTQMNLYNLNRSKRSYSRIHFIKGTNQLDFITEQIIQQEIVAFNYLQAFPALKK